MTAPSPSADPAAATPDPTADPAAATPDPTAAPAAAPDPTAAPDTTPTTDSDAGPAATEILVAAPADDGNGWTVTTTPTTDLLHQSTQHPTSTRQHRTRTGALLSARLRLRAHGGGILITKEPPSATAAIIHKDLRHHKPLIAIFATITTLWPFLDPAWRNGIAPAAFGAILIAGAIAGLSQAAFAAPPPPQHTQLRRHLTLRLAAVAAAGAVLAGTALTTAATPGTWRIIPTTLTVVTATATLTLLLSLITGLVEYAHCTNPSLEPLTPSDPEPDKHHDTHRRCATDTQAR